MFHGGNWPVAVGAAIVLSSGSTAMLPVRHIPAGVLALAALLGVAGCDGGARTPDARAQTSSVRSAELSVRFEVDASKPATVSVLGFRAAAVGPTGAAVGADELDVLGLVDPLGAAAPVEGCALHDGDQAASALGNWGGSVDLQELGGVGVGLGAADGPSAPLIRAFPRVFPDVAGVVGGVVGEAGPQPVTTVPEHVTFFGADSELPIAELPVPQLPRLLAVNGSAPAPGAHVDASGGLSLTLAAPAGSLVELRPYGATVAVVCSIPTNASTEATVAVPRTLLAHLYGSGPGEGTSVPASMNARSGLPIDVSIELVRRTQLRAPLGTAATRISVEVRSALAVELRP